MKTLKVFSVVILVLLINSIPKSNYSTVTLKNEKSSNLDKKINPLDSIPLFGCSTFMLKNDDYFLVGHNLDENMEMPGKIYINKRGVEKKSIAFNELFDGITDTLPKLEWVSKYGSVTYNAFGREFADGGLNEAGLYIGEMTLIQDYNYSPDENRPYIAALQWLQYILDNYANVDDAIQSFSKYSIDDMGGGICNWHYFIADKAGNHVIIEFINGEIVIYKNDDITIKFLGNNQYSMDLDTLKIFNGYGGNKEIDLNEYPDSSDYRIMYAAYMLENFKQNSTKSAVDYAFDILKQLDLGNNKWSVLYDVINMKMYYRTYKDTDVKYLDFYSFDFSCNEPVLMLDINKDLNGNVVDSFIPYVWQANRNHTEELFMGIEGLREMETLPEIIDRFSKYPETVICK